MSVLFLIGLELCASLPGPFPKTAKSLITISLKLYLKERALFHRLVNKLVERVFFISKRASDLRRLVVVGSEDAVPLWDGRLHCTLQSEKVVYD